MRKSEIKALPTFYARYVAQVEDEPLLPLLRKYPSFMKGEEALLRQSADLQYAPDKWTPKDIIQHLIDTERVFSYRALRFSRGDQTELPGFDQSQFADAAPLNHREMDDLLEEFRQVRQSSRLFFDSLQAGQFSSSGMASGVEMSVLALGFLLIGHQLHHANLLRKRYFPLIGKS